MGQDKVWYYNGTRQDGVLMSFSAIDNAQCLEYDKKGWIRVLEYNGRFGDIDMNKKSKTTNNPTIDWTTVTVDQTTMKLLKAKAKELDISVPKKCKEEKLLKLIQDSIGG